MKSRDLCPQDTIHVLTSLGIGLFLIWYNVIQLWLELYVLDGGPNCKKSVCYSSMQTKWIYARLRRLSSDLCSTTWLLLGCFRTLERAMQDSQAHPIFSANNQDRDLPKNKRSKSISSSGFLQWGYTQGPSTPNIDHKMVKHGIDFFGK